MACMWRVAVLVLQIDLDQIFQDSGRIVVTCVNAQDAKISTNIRQIRRLIFLKQNHIFGDWDMSRVQHLRKIMQLCNS
jgi:hypothetical protein